MLLKSLQVKIDKPATSSSYRNCKVYTPVYTCIHIVYNINTYVDVLLGSEENILH